MNAKTLYAKFLQFFGQDALDEIDHKEDWEAFVTYWLKNDEGLTDPEAAAMLASNEFKFIP